MLIRISIEFDHKFQEDYWDVSYACNLQIHCTNLYEGSLHNFKALQINCEVIMMIEKWNQ